MNLSTITEDPHVARRAFLDYRHRVRADARRQLTEAERELNEIDRELLRAYRELARGVTLLRLTDTIRAGGYDDSRPGRWGSVCALPRLAIAQATARTVWTEGVANNQHVLFSTELTWQNRELLSRARTKSVDVVPGWERKDEWRSGMFSATVPTVPPQFRPTHGLGGYHVLFEADWNAEPEPADPALLKHIGGDLWAVLATWDLTPLEAAVLGQRR